MTLTNDTPIATPKTINSGAILLLGLLPERFRKCLLRMAS
jgi:hypothetical protein